MKYAQKNALKWSVIALSAALLTACGGGNDNNTNSNNSNNSNTSQDAQFSIRLTNLTHAQPMSPVAVMLHRNGFNSFIDGETASRALEVLAEDGDNTEVLQEVQAATQHVASGSTASAISPRAISDAVTLNVPTADLADLRLSVVSMLVHTNDGFTGANAENISNMAVGASMTINGPTWDAGTENNTELATSLPGPDFSGEGFNAVRDDIIDKVRFHQGAVTNASVESGLPTSDLEERHRFLNPTSRIVITRTQ